jgi:hypothetical protein
MALLADASRFEQGDWYSQYRRYDFFAQRAAWIHATVPTGKLLVAGCGWGYLVDELVKLGRDAWGIDASSYCAGKGIAPGRVLTRSALVRADVNAAKTAAGIAGGGKFAAGITEDLLPCLTVAEITSALGELRRACTSLLHIVTPGDGSAQPPGRVPEMTWRSHQEWVDFPTIGSSGERVYNAETGAVL